MRASECGAATNPCGPRDLALINMRRARRFAASVLTPHRVFLKKWMSPPMVSTCYERVSRGGWLLLLCVENALAAAPVWQCSHLWMAALSAFKNSWLQRNNGKTPKKVVSSGGLAECVWLEFPLAITMVCLFRVTRCNDRIFFRAHQRWIARERIKVAVCVCVSVMCARLGNATIKEAING
jgi:hypothetical protein